MINHPASVKQVATFYYKIALAQSLQSRFTQKNLAVKYYEALLEEIKALPRDTEPVVKNLFSNIRTYIKAQLMTLYLEQDSPQFEKSRIIGNELIKNPEPEIEEAYAKYVFAMIRIDQKSLSASSGLQFSNLLKQYANSRPQPQDTFNITLESGKKLLITGNVLSLIISRMTPQEKKAFDIGAVELVPNHNTDRTRKALSSIVLNKPTVSHSIASLEGVTALPHYLEVIHKFDSVFLTFKATSNMTLNQVKNLAPTKFGDLNEYIFAKLKTYTIPAFNFMNKEEVKTMAQLFKTPSTDPEWHTLQFQGIDNLLLALHGKYKGSDPFLIFAQNNPAAIKNALGLETTSAQDLDYFELQVKSQHLLSKDYYISTDRLQKTSVLLSVGENLKELQTFCSNHKNRYTLSLTPRTASEQQSILTGKASHITNQYNYTLVVTGKVSDAELSDLKAILPSQAESLTNLSVMSSGATQRDYSRYYADLAQLRTDYIAFLRNYGNVKQFRRDNDELQILTANTRLLQLEKQLDVYEIKPHTTIDPVEIGSLGGLGRQKWANELALFEKYLPNRKPLFERLLTLQSIARRVVAKPTLASEDFLWRFGEGKELLLSLTMDIGYEYMALMAEIKRKDPNKYEKYITYINKAIETFQEAIKIYNKLPVDKNKPQIAIYGANAYKSIAFLQNTIGSVKPEVITQNANAALNLYQGVLADIDTKSPSEISRLYRAHYEPPYQSAAYEAEISKLSLLSLRADMANHVKQPLTVGRKLKAEMMETLKKYNDLIARIEHNPMVDVNSELMSVNTCLLTMGNLLRSTAMLKEQMTEPEREKLLVMARSMAAVAKSKSALSVSLVPEKSKRSLTQIHRQAMNLSALVRLSLGDHQFEKLNEAMAIKMWSEAPEHILPLMGKDGYYTDVKSGLKIQATAAFNLENFKNSEKYARELCNFDLATVEEKAEAKLSLGYIILAKDIAGKNEKDYQSSLNLFNEVINMSPPPQYPDILTNAQLGKSSAQMELLAFDWSAGRYKAAQARFNDIERSLIPITHNPKAFNVQRAQAYFMLTSINTYRLSPLHLAQAIEYTKQGIALLGELEKDHIAYDKHLGYQAIMQVVESLSRTDTGLQAAMEIVTAISNNTELNNKSELMKNLNNIIAAAKPTQQTRDEGRLGLTLAKTNSQIYQFQSALDNLDKARSYRGVTVDGKTYRQYQLRDIVNLHLRSAATYNDINTLSIDAHQQPLDAQANKELITTIQEINDFSSSSIPGANEQRTVLLSRALMLLWSSSDATLETPLRVAGDVFPAGPLNRNALKNKAISLLKDALKDKSVPIITQCKYKLALAAIYNRLDLFDEAKGLFNEIEGDIARFPAADKAFMDVNLHLRLSRNWSELGKGYLDIYSQSIDGCFKQAEKAFNAIIQSNAPMIADAAAKKQGISIEFQKQQILAYTGLGELYGARGNPGDWDTAESYFNQALALFGNKYPDFQVLQAIVNKAIDTVRLKKDPRSVPGLVESQAKAMQSPADFPREDFNAALVKAKDLKLQGELEGAQNVVKAILPYLIFELNKADGNVIASGDYSQYVDTFMSLVDNLILQGKYTQALTLLQTLKHPKNKTNRPPAWVDLQATLDQKIETARSHIHLANENHKAALPLKHTEITPTVIAKQLSKVAKNYKHGKVITGINTFSAKVENLVQQAMVQFELGNRDKVRTILTELAPLLDPKTPSSEAESIGGNALALSRMQYLLLRANEENTYYQKYASATKTMNELFEIFDRLGGGNYDFELSSYLLQIRFLTDTEKTFIIDDIFKNKLHFNAKTGKVELGSDLDRKKELTLQTKFSNLIPLYYADYLKSQMKYKEALSLYSQVLKDFPSNPGFKNINDSAAYYNALLGQLECLTEDMTQLTPERQSLINSNILALKSMTPKNNELHDISLKATQALTTSLEGDTYTQQGRYTDAVNAYKAAFTLEISRQNIGINSMLIQLGIEASKTAAGKHL